jgi:hypothetical protein
VTVTNLIFGANIFTLAKWLQSLPLPSALSQIILTKKEVPTVATKNIMIDLPKIQIVDFFQCRLNFLAVNLIFNIFFQFQVFGSDRIRAFGMAKFLSAHLS